MDAFEIILQQIQKCDADPQCESNLYLKSHSTQRKRYINTEVNGGLPFFTIFFTDVYGQIHSMPLTTQEFIDFVEREYLI